jgi:hypothetical protein
LKESLLEAKFAEQKLLFASFISFFKGLHPFYKSPNYLTLNILHENILPFINSKSFPIDYQRAGANLTRNQHARTRCQRGETSFALRFYPR